ncbi:MAG: TetR/AcrR family transcriptional regulator [Gemmatimonadaceae bacterium]|nr:TetR/AcrR family transcriptional regulator [Gemmatimonadaceae bacterium]
MPQATPARQRRHDAILDAAARCLVRDGLDGTTMEAIALEAGVSRATVFNHVSGKHGLLTALYDRQLARLDAQLSRSPARGPLAAQLRWYFTTAEAVLRADGALTPLLVREVLRDPVLLERDLTHGQSARHELVRIVREARAVGVLRRDVPTTEIVVALMDIWSATLIPWAAAGASGPLARTVLRKVRLLLDGLGSHA